VWTNWWRRGRRLALVAAGLWCVVLGIGVTGALIDDNSLGRAGTVTLLGAVGMLVLPGLTAAALRLDSRERRRMSAARQGVHAPSADRVSHPAHADSTRREAPEHRVRGRSGERVP
jgi:hypothetical protein